MAAIEVRHLSCAYKTHPILRDISLAVEIGEFFIVIGPNGSGKTTLMKALTGVLNPCSGHIAVLGRPLKAYSRKRLARTMAYVPQGLPTDFPFTALEVVLMGRTPHLGFLGLESASDLDLAAKAMQFTEINHLAHRRLNELSGGECQRVLIARAICQQPKIIFLDEPTAALDLAHQVRVMDLMERLKNEQGQTIVMISHDLNLAAMYGDRLLLLEDGRIATLGPPNEVLDYRILEKVYGCTLLVDANPLADLPRVNLVPEKYMLAHKAGL
jgi:iron complex transport system ATP-binding protein